MKKSIKNVILAGLLAVSVIPSSVQAGENEKSFAEIYTDCGLGGLFGSIVNKQSKITSDILAVVTNVVWDLGTTASSSAITTPDTCLNNKTALASLINQGYEEIEQELAIGDGKYLKAISQLKEHPEQSNAEFISSLRTQFSDIVSNENYENLSHYKKAETLFNTID